MEEFLNYILSGIVDHEQEVKITKEEESDVLRFNIELHDEDYPRVIGKRGLTIKAITDVLRLYDVKKYPDLRRRVFINVTEN
ncbi:hypothetical protein A3H80_03765 [Candidatus Roizmanbacteria bacterium RIFCSPLOWO2_02_FULL_37_19]|uniref:Uncharacterized protein n=1 Tax=Candidatus Roizmanbacteria bacterium RIFCSPHIGHO2_02_FULL_37_24 TaxID=1802037 RepID=A0A1F7GVX2_9BACT|nr:MAG: hypothetical protein A2862_01855 [Candidatus Roizmanbacteria bacterium RIFCSPHIGHO2_01_FULL_38_41]OGK22914.1 MAG: hypothetical protein A3C24_03575 [Candidatus Roizmanbacteria bacterium RIFCSPHIGHO2_02_FULL_37_24]OGK33632.1 MAG: hypothetical protein A3E10_05210 [Candidatus Roizmanbacteria bacterium RIFCSPHIGHO2_12_FULL_37_23]OGK44981.1 MAG: hypothetical protein A2956_00360 [Candidatus Roizmanbacteria bacterium RIFCSPLOWO2_01_FULL_37_57]OGK55284.1 MAG: hypothetical protein A3H80_03765 [Ca